MLHNKKGMFLPLFIIIIPIILAALLYVMSQTEAQKEDLVGLKAINLIKLYDETEKIDLYLDLSSKYSNKNTLKSLAANGGYSDDNRCEKTEATLLEKESYVIWNTCPILNLNQEFLIQFKKELKSFINNYQSVYSNTNYKWFFDVEKETEVDYGKIYTDNVKNSNIINIKYYEEDLLVNISDIVLSVEESENSNIILKPKLSVKKTDLSVYKLLHNNIQEYCIKKEFSECENKLKQIFENIEIQEENDIVRINFPQKDYKIKLAFNIKFDLQSIQ